MTQLSHPPGITIVFHTSLVFDDTSNFWRVWVSDLVKCLAFWIHVIYISQLEKTYGLRKKMTKVRHQFPQITSEEHTTISLIEESHLKDLVKASFAWLSLLEGYLALFTCHSPYSMLLKRVSNQSPQNPHGGWCVGDLHPFERWSRYSCMFMYSPLFYRMSCISLILTILSFYSHTII